MYFENLIYLNNKFNYHGLITQMLGAELRNAIQTWRKVNDLPIDYIIPTLKVYFKEPILKTVLMEGICDNSNEHLAKICLIDKIIFEEPTQQNKDLFETHDICFWSDLGGTIGFSDLLFKNEKNIQKSVDKVINEKTYNQYI